MKTYRIVGTNGKTYTLSGVVDEVKQEIEDAVQAGERVKLHRQLKKGLLTMEIFTVEQQALAGIHFQSEPVLFYIATEKGGRHLFRELLIAGGKCPEPTDADVTAVYEAQKVEGSEAWAVVKRIWEEAYPKAPKGTARTKAGPPSPNSTDDETTGSDSLPTVKVADLTPACTAG